jgi:hypothetical protein
LRTIYLGRGHFLLRIWATYNALQCLVFGHAQHRINPFTTKRPAVRRM